MSYKCVIVDDEPLARELIETYINKLPDFTIVASCKNAIEASNILNSESIDLLFLDINLPVLKGTDFFKNLIHKPQVIFTTAYREYAVEGFELNAIDYLLKPIVFERFFMAIQKFIKTQQPSVSEATAEKQDEKIDYIFVSKARKQIKVYLDNVLYIESFKDYIKIHFTDDELMVKESISHFEKRIDNRFLRTHRSYIVNQEKITAFTKQDIEIGKIEIPIGDSYRTSVNEVLFV